MKSSLPTSNSSQQTSTKKDPTITEQNILIKKLQEQLKSLLPTSNSSQQTSTKKLPPPIVGINNKGNTCYINAVVQALCACTPFVDMDWLDLQVQLQNYVGLDVKEEEHQCTATMEYALSMIKLVNCMRFVSSNPFDKKKLQDLWEKIDNIKDVDGKSKKFPVDRQGDAAELLVFTIDYFNVLFKILEKESYLDRTHYVFANTYCQHELCEKGWSKGEGKRTFTYNSPYITNCFGLTTLRRLRQHDKCSCGEMRKEKETTDLSTYIVLSFPNKKKSTKQLIDIQTLFKYYFQEDEDMKLNCSNDNCEKQVGIIESCKLYNFPKVLLIYLNRFCSDMEGNTTKNTSRVKIPLRELDISKYVLNYEEHENVYKQKYDLFHVIFHDGTTPESGHYTNCHLYKGNAWHIINDKIIMPVTDKEIMEKLKTNEPYVLL